MALNKMRSPDVVLEVEGVNFPCRRDKLASQSSYFQAMFGDHFKERNQDIIKIEGIDATTMKVILNWIEDSSLMDSLQAEEILVVLQAAAMLQIENLQNACEEIMLNRYLMTETCLSTVTISDRLSLCKLHKKSFSLALWNFSEVRQTEAFLDLNVDYVEQYLGNDALNVISDGEYEVFEAAASWLEHDLSERNIHTMRLMSCVRLGQIPASDVQSMKNYACITDNSSAFELLDCVLLLKKGMDPNIKAIHENVTEVELEEKSGCCDTLKRLADHMRPCNSSSSTPEICLSPTDSSDSYILVDDIPKYSEDIVILAQKLLSLNARQLPYVACVIGYTVAPGQMDQDLKNLPNCTVTKKQKSQKSKNGSPYIFYYDDKKNQVIPFLHLSKIDESPVEAIGYAAISKGQDIYLVGGEYLLGYGDWNKSIWNYNIWKESWSYETSLLVARRHHSVVCLNEDMYVIGGCGRYRVILDTMDRYNFTTKTWHKCAPMPTCLYSAAACVHKNLIFVIASQVFCFTPVSNTWIINGEILIPPGSSFNTAMSYGQYIYLTGFYSGNLMRFDPLTAKEITKIGSFRNLAGNACLVKDKIYTFTTEEEDACIEVFDISTQTFLVVWEGKKEDTIFSVKRSGGCFPAILFQ